jgi:hypothetical protein
MMRDEEAAGPLEVYLELLVLAKQLANRGQGYPAGSGERCPACQ